MVASNLPVVRHGQVRTPDSDHDLVGASVVGASLAWAEVGEGVSSRTGSATPSRITAPAASSCQPGPVPSTSPESP